MNKREMAKELQGKIEGLLFKKDEINSYVDGMDGFMLDSKQELARLKKGLAESQEQKVNATDGDKVRQAVKNIRLLENEIEEQEAVIIAMENKGKKELGALVDDFFSLHSHVRTMYKPVHDLYLAETSIKNIEKDIEELQGIASNINLSFAGVRNIMADYGLTGKADRFYKTASSKSVHLGQMGVDLNRLHHLKQDLQPYARLLNA